jgi:DNA-binding transcriptional MocR family regulator
MDNQQRKNTVYEGIAEHVEALIRSQVLQPGDRIPSLRKMHRDTGRSLTSVLQAYQLLEDRGWIVSHPQSGYYVRQRASAALAADEPPSETWLDEVAGGLLTTYLRASSHAGLHQLAESSLGTELFPLERLARIAARLVREPLRMSGIEDPKGDPELRREIAKLAARGGHGAFAHEILVTASLSESWQLALRLVAEAGDTIVVDTPTYPGVFEVAQALRLQVVALPRLASGVPDWPRITALIASSKALFLTPDLAPPGGGQWGDEDTARLTRLCAEERCPIVETGVYREWHFDLRPRPRFQDADREGWVLHCGSFSEVVSPALRVAWIAPGRFAADALRVKTAFSGAAPTLPQRVLAAYLAGGGYEKHMRQAIAFLTDQFPLYRRAIAQHFPTGTRVFAPPCGAGFWLELPEGVRGIDLFRRALKAGIVIAPGTLFAPGGGYEAFVRLAFGRPLNPGTDEALARLGAIAAALTPR